MSSNEQNWMIGLLNDKVFYTPAEWMKGDWNGDFFYELCKLGDIACIKFSQDLGLIPRSYECPTCGGDMKIHNAKDRWYWACRKREPKIHYTKRSLRRSTWFQASHLSIGHILRLTYMWVNKIPRESIINDLGFAGQTVADWINLCKEVCVDYCLRFDGQVGGVSKTVDIYDAWLNEKKHKNERNLRGKSVFVGLVRNMHDCFVEVVEDRNAEVLVEVIIKRVAPGSTILINNRSLYGDSQALFEQLEVLHSVTISDSSKSSDGTWIKVKKLLQGNDFLEGEFTGVVAEYIWRRQNNLVHPEKVKSFFKAIAESYPPTTKD